MTYIQPNSVIQLFQGINLDNRYMHTIYFASVSAQDSWFASRVTANFQAQSYTRYTRNQVKIQCDVTSILGCSYMRFLNDRAGDKWFYAFINAVEYVNENTALVTYEIDVMQTWFIAGGSVRPCMVLREHVNDDTFGLNLEEEPIGSEIYDSDYLDKFDSLFNDLTGAYDTSVVIRTTGKDSETGHNYISQGLFDGTKYRFERVAHGGTGVNVADTLDRLLGSWSAGQQQEEVIDMYTVPTNLTTQGNDFQEFALTLTRPTTYDQYTPKNNKLFMYPYSYLVCTTHNGQSGMYRWEYFDGSSVEFRAMGTCASGGQVIMYPRAYNGQEENFDCAVTINDFPKNAFNYDAYQAWIANGGKVKLENAQEITDLKGIAVKANFLQTQTANVSQAIDSTLKGGIGLMTGNPYLAFQGELGVASAGFATARNIAETKAYLKEAQNKINYQWKDARYRPNYTIGTSTPALAVGARYLNYYYYHVHVRDDEAKRLDDFLSCYGYAVDRVKAPNITGRRYWNFVQTKDAVIAGAMPASAKEAIGRIFDGGITFWHNGDQIGNYRQSVSDGTINNPIV